MHLPICIAFKLSHKLLTNLYISSSIHSFIHRHQSSAGGNGCGSGGGLEVVTARTQGHLGEGGGYDHRGSAVR